MTPYRIKNRFIIAWLLSRGWMWMHTEADENHSVWFSYEPTIKFKDDVYLFKQLTNGTYSESMRQVMQEIKHYQ